MHPSSPSGAWADLSRWLQARLHHVRNGRHARNQRVDQEQATNLRYGREFMSASHAHLRRFSLSISVVTRERADRQNGAKSVFDAREEAGKHRECVLVWNEDSQVGPSTIAGRSHLVRPGYTQSMTMTAPGSHHPNDILQHLTV
jgi:hypothetical protein